MDNYYQILNVNTNASQEEIRTRYFFLVKVYHPDRFVNQADKYQAEEELKKINSAYSVLGDERKRKEYDREIGFDLDTNNGPQDEEPIQSPSKNDFSKKSDSNAHMISFCSFCGNISNTYPATYRKNIGMLVLRKYHSVSGEFCADCHEKIFWNCFLINLFLGWWGLISFAINPFLIIMNIYNYMRSWKIRNIAVSSNKSPADMKFVGVIILFVIGVSIIWLNKSIWPSIKSISNIPPTQPYIAKQNVSSDNTHNILLYATNFSENDGLWLEKDDGLDKFEILNGHYIISSKYHNSCTSFNVDKIFKDGIMTVDIIDKILPQGTAYFINWRYKDTSNYYGMYFVDDGSIIVFRYVNGNGSLIPESLNENSTKDYSHTKNVIVSFIGTTMQIYIDKVLFTTFQDANFIEGSIGLGICTGETGSASITYDNLFVYSPEGSNQVIPKQIPSNPLTATRTPTVYYYFP